MKDIIILVLFTFCWSCVYAQVDTVYTLVEEMPEPEGGMQKFYTFLAKNLRYNPSIRKEGLKKAPNFELIIYKDGKLEAISKNDNFENLDTVLSNGPVWKPGKLNGILVSVKITVTMSIRISD